MDVQAVEWESVDGIHLAQYRIKWRAVENTVMNVRDPQNAEISSLAEELSASQGGL